MASPGGRVLDINDFHAVDQICEHFSADWKKIGGRLQISKNTIEIIGKDNNDKVKECMSELIAKWLKRETLQQPRPTWSILCDAIATVDRTAAERIATEKGVNIPHSDPSTIPNPTAPNQLTTDHKESVDETVLTLSEDEECTLDWPDYGLQIDFPKGSLPSGHTAVEIPVKAIVAGDFILPPDCHLVSGIYWINCPYRFDKKVTLHLPHAAIIESDEASCFRFFAAKCSGGPPYQFKELAGGSFTPFSKSASIMLHQFSYFCVGGIVRAIGDWVWGIRQRYYSQVFYKLKQPHEWDVLLVVTKDDPAFQQFIKNKYSDCLDGAHQTIKLQENASCIRLQTNSDCLDQWKMSEIISSQIDKEDIDYFTPERTLGVPHCHFNFCWNSEMPLKILKMKIVLEGASEPNNFFRVILPHTAPPGLSFQDVLDKPPEIKDVFDFVKYISALWNEFGRELNVHENYRATFKRDVSLSDEDRLESVLSKWIEKETKAVKWRVVLEALNALEKKDIIKKVITYLEKPETYRKYISMDDFSPCLFRST